MIIMVIVTPCGRKTTVVPIPVHNNNNNNDMITTCTIVVCVGTSLNILLYNSILLCVLTARARFAKPITVD